MNGSCIWGAVCMLHLVTPFRLCHAALLTLESWRKFKKTHRQKRQMRPVVNSSQCCIALPMSHLYCHWLILPPPHPPGLAPLLLFQHTLKDLCMWVAHTCEHGWWWITLTRYCCLLLCHYLTYVFMSSLVMSDETPATNH